MSGLEHGAFLDIGRIVSAVRPFKDTEPSKLLHNKVQQRTPEENLPISRHFLLSKAGSYRFFVP